MNNKVALIGFDLEVLESLEDDKFINIIGYVDNKKVNFEGLNYLGDDVEFINTLNKDVKVILSMDIPKVRAKLFDFYKNNMFEFISHKTSGIS